MATPTINDIKQEILAKKAEYATLNGVDSTSKVALFNLWAYITAAAMWTLYQSFDLFKKETDEKIRAQKVYSLLWFRDMALAYRHGHPLVKDKYLLEYSDDGYTEADIEAAKVVKRAAVIELELNARKFLFVKCATEDGADLAKLTEAQQQGVVDYFKRIKPAGTKLEVYSGDADELRLTVDFYYDPLVLTDAGAMIDGTNNTPVQDAIRNYLKNLRFNGEFSVAELEDIIQSVPGCSDREAYVKVASANFQTPANFQTVTDTYIAKSGYMDISDADLTINFKSKTVLN